MALYFKSSLGCPGNPNCKCNCSRPSGALGLAVVDSRDPLLDAEPVPGPTGMPLQPIPRLQTTCTNPTGIRLELDGRMLLGVIALAIASRWIARR